MPYIDSRTAGSIFENVCNRMVRKLLGKWNHADGQISLRPLSNSSKVSRPDHGVETFNICAEEYTMVDGHNIENIDHKEKRLLFFNSCKFTICGCVDY